MKNLSYEIAPHWEVAAAKNLSILFKNLLFFCVIHRKLIFFRFPIAIYKCFYAILPRSILERVPKIISSCCTPQFSAYLVTPGIH
nr:MAG TPA: hypothetical protein [Inoviridae sp.]